MTCCVEAFTHWYPGSDERLCCLPGQRPSRSGFMNEQGLRPTALLLRQFASVPSGEQRPHPKSSSPVSQGAHGRSQPFLAPPGPKSLLTGSQRSGHAVWTQSRCLVSPSPGSQAFPPQPSLNPTTGPGRCLPWFLCWTLCPALSQLSPGRRGETFHLYSLDWLQS